MKLVICFALFAVTWARTIELDEPIIDFVPLDDNPHIKPTSEVIPEVQPDDSLKVSPDQQQPQGFDPEVVVVETGSRRPFLNPFFQTFLFPSRPSLENDDDFFPTFDLPSFGVQQNPRPMYPLFPSLKHLHDDIEDMRRNMFQLFAGFPMFQTSRFPGFIDSVDEEEETDQDVLSFHNLPSVYNDTKEYNKTDSDGNVINVHEVTRKNVTDGVSSFFHLKIFNVMPKDILTTLPTAGSVDESVEDEILVEPERVNDSEVINNEENEIADIDLGEKVVPIV